MKIYIGFSKPSGKFVPFAWLIKWVEARPYDHAYVRFQEPKGDWMIFQASKEIVNIYNVPLWLQSNVSLKEYEIEVTEAQSDALWKFIKKGLGTPYSLSEDFGILLMKIFKLKNNPLSKGMSAAFCSEEAARICELLGIDVGDSPDNIDPSGLDAILSTKNLPCVLDPDLVSVG